MNFGGVLLKQVLNFLLMLETMTAQLWQIYMLNCHMMFKNGLTLFILKDRSLTSRLYNLKERIQASKLYPNCSVLSQKVISYFAKCFSHAISQNAGIQML